MSIHVLVLNWNGGPLTLECLATLPKGVRATVIDNGSTDGSPGMLHGWDVLALPRNYGFAIGFNRGIEHAMAAGADRIVLLNNDTLLAPDLIDELARAMSDGVGIAGPISYYASAPGRVWASGGTVHLRTGLRRHEHDVPTEVVDRDYMPAVCWMVRREVFERVGLLPTSYGFYFEDLEFCVRVRRAGWRVVCAPRARLWHKVSASAGGESSPRVKFLASRNRFTFVRRLGFRSSVPLVAGIHAIEFSVRVLTGDAARAGAVFRGTMAGFVADADREVLPGR